MAKDQVSYLTIKFRMLDVKLRETEADVYEAQFQIKEAKEKCSSSE